MTHHATNLDLPGEANITTAAGDVATFQSTGSNTVQCISYVKADGTAVVSAGAGTAILGSDADNLTRWGNVQINCEAGATILVQPQAGGRGYNRAVAWDGTQTGSIAASGNETEGSGATEVTYSLDAGGSVLTIDLAESVTNILVAKIVSNDTGTALNIQPILTANNLVMRFKNATSDAGVDLTGITSKSIQFQIGFIVGGTN